MNKVVLLSLGAVKTFRGYDVKLGVVQVSDGEFVEHLDSTFAEVALCNHNVKPGSALQVVAPFWFQTLKNEYQEELQSSLRSQVIQGNDVDIDFHYNM
jgi:hypothetical protein